MVIVSNKYTHLQAEADDDGTGKQHPDQAHQDEEVPLGAPLRAYEAPAPELQTLLDGQRPGPCMHDVAVG